MTIITKFSVGKVILKQSAVVKKEIIPTTEIVMSYDISTQKRHDSDGNVTDEFEETKSLSIEITYAADSFDTTLIEGGEYDLFLETGARGGGITATLANCKLTNYSTRTAQSEFAMTTLTFSKRGELGDTPGTEPTRQKVKFDSIYIGDSAFVTTSYIGNARSLIIPTALGVLLQHTNSLGGGKLNIRIRGYVRKNTRLELEQYLVNLYTSLSTEKKTITVEYGLSSYTITDCIFVSGNAEAGNKNYTDFELIFARSAY